MTVDASGGSEIATGLLGVRLRRFATLVAELIMTKTMYGDTIVRLRRQSGMGLAAEMQWSLLPPLTFACQEVTIAAALEPAYEVAGDTVDYAVDAGWARVAVLDGMGHGLRSAQLATLAVAAYRNARRADRSLIDTAALIHDALVDAFGGTAFATAVLAELDTDTGMLTWVNAGHPPPLLLRQGKLVRSLHSRPALPLGLVVTGRPPATVAVGREQLQPNDRVLFYTDGVTEARSPTGAFFGEQALIDLLGETSPPAYPPRRPCDASSTPYSTTAEANSPTTPPSSCWNGETPTPTPSRRRGRCCRGPAVIHGETTLHMRRGPSTRPRDLWHWAIPYRKGWPRRNGTVHDDLRCASREVSSATGPDACRPPDRTPFRRPGGVRARRSRQLSRAVDSRGYAASGTVRAVSARTPFDDLTA